MAERPYFCHPTACIDEPVSIGEGTKVWHFCHVMKGAMIGRNCSLAQNVLVASTAKLGSNVRVQNNVAIYDAVVLEDDVFCGPSMVFTNVRTPRANVSRKDSYDKTLVKRGATLGANSTIVCGVTIGEFAFIGAAAVVTHDVPPHAVVVGNPARRRGWACECGEMLRFDGDAAACKRCSRKYRKRGDAAVEEIR